LGGCAWSWQFDGESKNRAKERLDMKRRELLQKSAALGFFAAMPLSLYERAGEAEQGHSTGGEGTDKAASVANPLKAPAEGNIPVAFLISDGAVLIDFVGPWEVFQNVNLPGSMGGAFHLYTVGETTNAVNAGGMKIVPDYTLESAKRAQRRDDGMDSQVDEEHGRDDVGVYGSVCAGSDGLAGRQGGDDASRFVYRFGDEVSGYPCEARRALCGGRESGVGGRTVVGN
jgi:hypothetical protein